MRPKVLIVDAEEGIRFTFETFLSNEGYDVTTAGDYAEAMDRISETAFDVIFGDLILKGPTGMNILREVRQKDPFRPVVMITGAPNDDTDLEAARLGGYEHLPKPLFQEPLLAAAKRALASRQSALSGRT